MSTSDQYRSAVVELVSPVQETVALGILPHGDHRDWKAIHAWAENLF